MNVEQELYVDEWADVPEMARPDRASPFAAYGSDAPFFEEVRRRRLVREEQYTLAATEAAHDFCDQFLPSPPFEDADLIAEERTLDDVVHQAELEELNHAAINWLKGEIEAKDEAGLLIPPHHVQKRWYDDYMQGVQEWRDAVIERENQPRPEAWASAYEILEDLEAALATPPEITDHKPTDDANQHLWDIDQETVQNLEGTDYIYLGHTAYKRRLLHEAMYQALVAGYNPDGKLLQKHSVANFLDDEISSLSDQHYDLVEMLESYGYRLTHEHVTPAIPRFVGAYVVPRPVLRSIFATLYERGNGSFLAGLKFPYQTSEEED